MKTFIIFIILIFSIQAQSQYNLDGVWQGIIYKNGQKDAETSIIFLDLNSKQNTYQGKSREEFYNSDFYIIHLLKGNFKDKKLTLQENVVEKKKTSSKQAVCNNEYTLTYDDSTGYLSGEYISSTCRGVGGKIILYRSTIKFTNDPLNLITHNWRDNFLKDLKKGRKAPEKQELERRNFKFHPIYFDYDMADIKPEYFEYLRRMANVVDGHSDLRIKITGHTDADGSDAYNIELSARRAKAIQDFFISTGIEDFKVIIDFKGESMPADNNTTPEGKQRNRRVDFRFI